jgi:hypothetical protein
MNLLVMVTESYKTYVVPAIFVHITFFFILQIDSLLNWGMDVTIKIYPLLSHLPLAVLIVVLFKTLMADFSNQCICLLSVLPASTLDWHCDRSRFRQHVHESHRLYCCRFCDVLFFAKICCEIRQTPYGAIN